MIKSAWLIFGFLFFISCSDTKNILADGSYTGHFYLTADSVSIQGPFTLNISGGEYHCSGNENRIPAGGSGFFLIEGTEVKFTDANMWTADFDWNLILNGEYTIGLSNDSVTLTKTLGQATYEYRIATGH